MMKQGTVPFPPYHPCTYRDGGASPALGVIACEEEHKIGGGKPGKRSGFFTISSEFF